MARKIILLAVLFALIFTLTNCGKPAPPEETTASTTATVPPPNPYLYHYYLGAMNRGDSRKLQGKILLTFFLVSDNQSHWTADAVQKLKTAHSQAPTMMKAEAASYGVSLDVTCKYILCTISGSMSRSEYKQGVQQALSAAGFSDPDKVSPALEEQFGVDDAPILFCVNRSERSCAVPSTDLRGFEYGVLYGNKEDYRHELYHLYGAKDLYPKSVKTIAESFFPTSVMLDSSLAVDELTAYLIGWTNTLSEKAVAFLEATKHINRNNFKDDTD